MNFMTTMSKPMFVQSSKLETTETRGGDIAHKLLHALAKPKLTYFLDVQAPTTIQPGHLKPIPFRLRAVPDPNPNETSFTVIGTTQKFSLVSLHIDLLDFIVATAALDTSRGGEELVERRELLKYKRKGGINLGLNHSHSLQPKHTIPFQPGPGSSSSSIAMFDTGRELGVHIDPKNPPGASFSKPLVQRVYKLEWKIEVECAGENAAVTGCVPVTIIDPAVDVVAAVGSDMPKAGWEDCLHSETRGGGLSLLATWTQDFC